MAQQERISSIELYPAFRLLLLARKNAPGEEATRGTLVSDKTARKLSI